MAHHPKHATEPVALLKTSIAPMLSVRNGPDAIDFYQSAFGANILFRIDNGGTVVARLAVDGAEFWVADESPEHQNSRDAVPGKKSQPRHLFEPYFPVAMQSLNDSVDDRLSDHCPMTVGMPLTAIRPHAPAKKTARP